MLAGMIKPPSCARRPSRVQQTRPDLAYSECCGISFLFSIQRSTWAQLRGSPAVDLQCPWLACARRAHHTAGWLSARRGLCGSAPMGALTSVRSIQGLSLAGGGLLWGCSGPRPLRGSWRARRQANAAGRWLGAAERRTRPATMRQRRMELPCPHGAVVPHLKVLMQPALQVARNWPNQRVTCAPTACRALHTAHEAVWKGDARLTASFHWVQPPQTSHGYNGCTQAGAGASACFTRDEIAGTTDWPEPRLQAPPTHRASKGVLMRPAAAPRLTGGQSIACMVRRHACLSSRRPIYRPTFKVIDPGRLAAAV